MNFKATPAARGVVLCELETAGPGRRVFIVAAGTPGSAIAADGIPKPRAGAAITARVILGPDDGPVFVVWVPI